jgi:hypothetical protein
MKKDDAFYDLPTGERIYIKYTYHKLSNGEILKQGPDKAYFDSQNHPLAKVPTNEIRFSVSLSYGATVRYADYRQQFVHIKDMPEPSPVKSVFYVYYSKGTAKRGLGLYYLYRADLL